MPSIRKLPSFSRAAAIALALSANLVATAQSPQAAPPAPAAPRHLGAAEFVRPTTFPNENKAAVAAALQRARKLAGDDLFSDMVHRCIISPVYNTRVRGIQHDGWVQPTKLFDNLYSVGQNAVSAFALTTSEGIVLIDTLDNEDEAKNLLVPNLLAAGLDPKAIKYIVISHAHGDHFGGAPYLAKAYGARVLASKIDWDAMDRQRTRVDGPFGAPPTRDMEIADGQLLKVGDTEIRFYVTPGHTDGVLSMIFKVHEGKESHTVGYFGGTGGGGGIANLRNQVISLERWKTLSKDAGVDVLVANHPLHDRGIENNELLRYRLPGDSNPYVIGQQRYQRYIGVQQECTRVQLARLGASEAP
jgi:metallo-beta-lactamase class B